jgi:hypothetical protein
MDTQNGYQLAQVGKGKAVHYSTGNDESVCGRIVARYLGFEDAAEREFCTRCVRYADTHGDYQGYDVENGRRFLSVTNPRPARPTDGVYSPAEAGARGWRDARPLWLDGRHVTAHVGDNGTRLYVFLGTEMIYDADMPTGITTDADVNPWVRQYAIGYVWAAEYRTLWSYRDHAGRVWGPYSDAEFRHTSGSAEEYCRGIVDTVGAGEVIRTDRTPEHFGTVGRNWTDVRTVVHVAGAPEEPQEDGQEAAPAPVTVWATTESGERINFAHVPNGDPARVSAFLADARAVPHFRNVSTTR